MPTGGGANSPVASPREPELLACPPFLFAMREDSRAEMHHGVYDGAEGIKRCYDNYHADCISGPGIMAVHTLTTPVIEIAEDLKTAKAVWVSPGHITGDMFSAKKEFKAH